MTEVGVLVVTARSTPRYTTSKPTDQNSLGHASRFLYACQALVTARGATAAQWWPRERNSPRLRPPAQRLIMPGGLVLHDRQLEAARNEVAMANVRTQMARSGGFSSMPPPDPNVRARGEQNSAHATH